MSLKQALRCEHISEGFYSYCTALKYVPEPTLSLWEKNMVTCTCAKEYHMII